MPSTASSLIIVVTDSKSEEGKEIALSQGDTARENLVASGIGVDAVVHCAPEEHALRNVLHTAVIGGVDFVITLGGVGFSPRDIVPGITESILDERFFGVEEALRRSAYDNHDYETALSRGVAGISASTVVINLKETSSAISSGMHVLAPFFPVLYQGFIKT